MCQCEGSLEPALQRPAMLNPMLAESSLTDLPVAVASTSAPEQAAEVAAVADASVVGTAIVEKIANALDENGNATPQLVSETLVRLRSCKGRAIRATRSKLMNWINNYVRPKIRSLVGVKSDVPENLWVRCPSCNRCCFTATSENLNVCGNCSHHMRLPARERLEILFDGGSFTEIELPENVTDPLKFRDRKRYSDRLGIPLYDRTNRRDHRRARRSQRPQDSHRSIRFFLHGRFDGDCRG